MTLVTPGTQGAFLSTNCVSFLSLKKRERESFGDGGCFGTGLHACTLFAHRVAEFQYNSNFHLPTVAHLGRYIAPTMYVVLSRRFMKVPTKMSDNLAYLVTRC